MPTFKVHLAQYVEEVAVLFVEAATVQEAHRLALAGASEADWQDGDDSYPATVERVDDVHETTIWERGQ